jgi:sugar lactone lactonase YvrE
MRRNLFLLLLSLVTMSVVATVPAQARTTLPDVYVVSDDPAVRPEGIAVASDGTMYVTSVSTGAVFRGHVRDRRMSVFLPAGSDGRTHAAGIHLDQRGRLFVAGYDSHALFVYSTSGRLLAKRVAANGDAALNDLVITDDAVYVTDSATGILWRASLDGSRVGELRAWLNPDDFPVAPGFLNGIVSSPDGRTLLVADGGTGSGTPGDAHLFRVDVRRQAVGEVTISGGYLATADGLLLEGNRLYAVVEFPDGQGGWTDSADLMILNRDLTAARWVDRSDTVTPFDGPTTIARDPYGRLLWANSQLLSPSPAPPFTVSRVRGLC